MADEKTEERLKAWEEALRGAGHEMRDPVVMIGTYIKLSLNEITNAKVEEYLKKAYGEVIELESLLDEIRDASKEIIDPSPSSFNLYDIVAQEVVKLKKLKEGKKYEGCEYILGKPEIDLSVYADPKHIKRVVRGLVKNAFEEIMEDPQIVEDTERQIMKINFSWDDNNTYVHFYNAQGIAPDILPKIFDRYFTTKKDGLGLGLDIREKYMKANSGDLRVVSSLENGTTLIMQVPLYKGQDKAPK